MMRQLLGTVTFNRQPFKRVAARICVLGDVVGKFYRDTDPDY